MTNVIVQSSSCFHKEVSTEYHVILIWVILEDQCFLSSNVSVLSNSGSCMPCRAEWLHVVPWFDWTVSWLLWSQGGPSEGNHLAIMIDWWGNSMKQSQAACCSDDVDSANSWKHFIHGENLGSMKTELNDIIINFIGLKHGKESIPNRITVIGVTDDSANCCSVNKRNSDVIIV